MNPYRHNQTQAIECFAEIKLKLKQLGLHLTLSNDRAIFIESTHTLIMADIHFGKAMHFRKRGIPMPDGVFKRDLNRLITLIEHYRAKHVIIAGDFYHDNANSEIDCFKDWRKKHLDIQFSLIKGNHDRLSDQFYLDLHFELFPSLLKLSLPLANSSQSDDNKSKCIAIVHEPSDAFDLINNKDEDIFVICGHLHPGIRLQQGKHKPIKTPCFLMGDNLLVLPAFTLFSGLDTQWNQVLNHHNLTEAFAITPRHILHKPL